MNILKKLLGRFFIDGLNGMVIGLFSTLIMGTLIQQLGKFIDGDIGSVMFLVGKVAVSLTGAGVGCGVAYKLKENSLVVFSAVIAGMIGGFSQSILSGIILTGGDVVLNGSGEPIVAFIAAYVAVEIGHLIAGKTSVDIILTPVASIGTGVLTGLFVGAWYSKLVVRILEFIQFGAKQDTILMGILVSVFMCIIFTLPIRPLSVGVVLGLSGISAGAATVGCCSSMIGFAVASYKDNKFGGVLAQGLGTSMLQFPNIIRKPIIWIPPILTSAILGPIATKVLGMTNTAKGSSMGTCGLAGPIATYQTMLATTDRTQLLVMIVMMHIVLPGILSYVIAEFLRKIGFIKSGDMKLEL